MIFSECKTEAIVIVQYESFTTFYGWLLYLIYEQSINIVPHTYSQNGSFTTLYFWKWNETQIHV